MTANTETERGELCDLIRKHLGEWATAEGHIDSESFPEIAAEIAADIQAARRAPVAPVLHEPVALTDTDVARIWRDHSGATRFDKDTREFAQRISDFRDDQWRLAAAPKPPEAAPVQLPEPVCYALYDSQGFYETRDTEQQCLDFCKHYNERDARLGGGLAPYTYGKLYTEQQMREALERT